MTETVYVKHRRKGNSGLTLHTDPECPRITMTEVFERDRDLYPEDTPVCEWCSGEVDLSKAGAPNTLSERLESLDPDAVGESDGR